MSWDDDLQGAAYSIASSNERVLRVIAGPGTGKTFSLMRRLARLLEEGIDPKRILLITFTRVAAQDLGKAIEEINIQGASNIDKGTLHSFCYRVLKENQVNELNNRVPRMLHEFEKDFLLVDIPREEFGNLKKKRKLLKDFEAAWARRQNETPGWPTDPVDRAFHTELLEWLIFHKTMLIGELVPRTLEFLRNNPQNDILQQFQYVFVDEYQDLNKAEQSVIDVLSENSSVMVIGDEDQSIYESIKYAHPEGIITFHESHEHTFDIPIEVCRRCPTKIVEIANSLIAKNLNRSDKHLQPRDGNSEGEINIVQWPSLDEEVNGVVEYVVNRINNSGINPGEVLVLTPRRHVAYLIRDGLHQRGISAHSFFKEPILDGNPRVTDDCRPLEAFSLLILLVNPEDKVAMRCWLGYGSESFRKSGYKHLWDYAIANDISIARALEGLITGELRIRYTRQILQRYRMLKKRIEELSSKSAEEAFDLIFPENADWALPIRELVLNSIADEDFTLPNISRLITEQISQPGIPPDLPVEGSFVRIMSLQKSKGLSSDHVIITNCIQGLIPTLRQEDPSQSRRELEEQRRLFYVAITRVKRSLLITSSATIPYGLAMKMNAQVGRNRGAGLSQSISSQFITDFGPQAPRIIRGQDFI